jgi:Heterokaryon incompatibility protein (HET)
MSLGEYKYEPLSAPTRPDTSTDKASSFQVRVVTLFPGSNEDDIRVAILPHTIRDDGDNTEDFEALSYTWGSAANPGNIFVQVDHGVQEDQRLHPDVRQQSSTSLQTLSVNGNLISALRHLRHSNHERRIWVDAICINQKPLIPAEKEEKQWSVQHMHIIYTRASRVVFWLGLSSGDSRIALEALEDIGAQFKYDETTYQIESVSQHFTLNPMLYRAITSLLQRPWFERVWVRQEAFGASQSSIIQCGHDTISMVHFRNAIQALTIEPLGQKTYPKYRERLGLALSVFQKAFTTILDIMFRIRNSQCYLAHDKVYGSLGMISMSVRDDFATGVIVDYSKPPEEVYMDFFLYYYERKRHLRMLTEGGLCQSSAMKPSWLPDWTVNWPRLDLSMEVASSHVVLAEATYLGHGKLRVNGVLASNIKAVVIMDIIHTGETVTLHELCAQLYDIMREQLPKDYADSMLEAMARGICSYLNSLREPLEDLELQRQDIIDFIKMIYKKGNLDPYLDCRHPNSIENMRMCLQFLRTTKTPLIFTNDHHVGIGCPKTQTRDIVSAVLGVNNLLIVRPVGGSNTYQLVGSCFVHGLNWGEALLGPLPDEVEVKPFLLPENGLYQPHYVNRASGEVSYFDPRIKWEELDESVSGGPHARRPPDTAYYRRHGVKLNELDLI